MAQLFYGSSLGWLMLHYQDRRRPPQASAYADYGGRSGTAFWPSWLASRAHRQGKLSHQRNREKIPTDLFATI
jgi:hypothetical protein